MITMSQDSNALLHMFDAKGILAFIGEMGVGGARVGNGHRGGYSLD